ncbi:hypothetical protein IW261DRAFT_1666533 [Armillaria novae-zelandiae]|uniref:Uncharacterized protein n=1 Tax=Armillaria novae-zelandiae TaxID=153914 RepID=A0AA39U6U4_9AGAR|nr:hypothetical protein IW261DRAFT_1666533 [Armillaria novae-zelandiae]
MKFALALLVPIALVAAQTITIEPISTSDGVTTSTSVSLPTPSTSLNSLPTTTETIPISISSTESESETASSTEITLSSTTTTSSSDSVTLSSSIETITSLTTPATTISQSSSTSRFAASSSAAVSTSASPAPSNAAVGNSYNVSLLSPWLFIDDNETFLCNILSSAWFTFVVGWVVMAAVVSIQEQDLNSLEDVTNFQRRVLHSLVSSNLGVRQIISAATAATLAHGFSSWDNKFTDYRFLVRTKERRGIQLYDDGYDWTLAIIDNLDGEEIIEELLQGAGILAGDILHKVEVNFPGKILPSDSDPYAVTRGVALTAGWFSEAEVTYNMSIIPLGLGVQISEEIFQPVTMKNTMLPKRASRRYVHLYGKTNSVLHWERGALGAIVYE